MLDIVSNSHSSLAFGIRCSIPFFLAIEVNKAGKMHLVHRVEGANSELLMIYDA